MAAALNDFDTGGRFYVRILMDIGGYSGIAGIVAGTPGQQLIIFNEAGSTSCVIYHDSGGSAAANRFWFNTALADGSIGPGEKGVFVYDGYLSRWSHLVTHPAT